MNAIEFFQILEHLTALRHEGEVAYQHKVLHLGGEGAEHGSTAYGLHHHVDDASSHILVGGGGIGLAEEGGSGMQRKARQIGVAYIAYEEVYLVVVALLGKLRHIVDIVRIEQQA